MIYYLLQLFKEYDIPGAGLISYLSFRSLMAALTALIMALIVGKKIIRAIQRHQIGEEIRDLGLEGQLAKKGTPTMGGIIIILSILTGVILWADLSNIYTILLCITLLWLGALGFCDDYIKVFKHNKEGMSEKAKLIGQISLGLIIGLTVCYSPKILVREDVSVKQKTEYVINDSGQVQTVTTTVAEDIVKSTKTTIPFVKDNEFDYKWLTPLKGKWGWWSKWAIYLIMIVLVITACSNSVNLTDGMDGLAAGTSAISGAVLLVFAYLSGNVIYSDYLNIMFIPGAGEASVFMSAMIGALIGFLWYNSYPAQVFMGDTGSLAVGGVIGVCAILIRKELLLPILCGIFFIEALSVIIQRYWFKRTKKKTGVGIRVFKMAPLHHHFQKEGIPALIQSPSGILPESKIVVRFWIVQIILAALSVALLKVR
ncbi:MAG: phospho-N-acetylmuramoyl-pentapeptide-transferase [Bacteroidales bacterium]|nr:phospho-N-acetylmuramoyl-pentapeptide-transferase [Candidatus Hennigimonas equi]